MHRQKMYTLKFIFLVKKSLNNSWLGLLKFEIYLHIDVSEKKNHITLLFIIQPFYDN